MSKKDTKPNTQNHAAENETIDGKTSEAAVIESLGLVQNKQALLELFKVPSLPLLRGADSVTTAQANQQLIGLYNQQTERMRQLYLASANIRPIYPICSLKNQFIEYEHYQLSVDLDKRAHLDDETVNQLWQQLHIVDELIMELVQNMPAHEPVGWRISSQGKNHLNLPTAGRQRYSETLADQVSINSYVLGHFGVMSYTYEKGYFIGHVLGYLFACYYFSYLSISYGVGSLDKTSVKDYPYKSLQTPHLVRLLQTLDGESKKRVYQLAVICAKLSIHATDKRIEKLLIAEVNDFSKKEQKNNIDRWLADGIMPLSTFSDGE